MSMSRCVCLRPALAARGFHWGLVQPASLACWTPRCESRRAVSSSRGAPTARRRLWRWGIGEQGAPEATIRPSIVEDCGEPTAIACGAEHSAFVVDGILRTYGSNDYQQLGRDAPAGDVAPVTVEAEDGYRPSVFQVALGGHHSAVISEGGALWTWGWGGSLWAGTGALGLGNTDTHAAPTLVRQFVEDGLEVTQVACGTQHTMALASDGRLYAAGRGKFARLGRGGMQDELHFREVDYFLQNNDSVLNPHEPTVLAKVDCGDTFSAAMSVHGEIWVWGRNDYGQIGLGAEATMKDQYSGSKYPLLMRNLPLEGHQIVDFACGQHHVTALTTAGAVFEWGNRIKFEPTPISLPSRYSGGIKNPARVVAGDGVSFVLTTDGQLYAWGPKNTGCLTQDPAEHKPVLEPSLVPAEVFNGQPVVDIASSGGRFLAITLES